MIPNRRIELFLISCCIAVHGEYFLHEGYPTTRMPIQSSQRGFHEKAGRHDGRPPEFL